MIYRDIQDRNVALGATATVSILVTTVVTSFVTVAVAEKASVVDSVTVVEALTGVSSLRVIRCMSVHARDRGCRKGRGGRNRLLRRHNFNTRGNHVDLAVAIDSVRESLWLLHALPVLDDKL